ncbi:hypothetical protein AAGV28_04695 [Flavobacterium sp. FZUC8N2.13]|uniref:Uncharacterized protein n=1 Tax=Flavobacterium zubiriense TaxID=3138075 RepID=A0ABV4T971_9FLAO
MENLFNNRSQIEILISQADDNKMTEKLILQFENLKKTRTPFYLKANELEQILEWKLRKQYSRQTKIRQNNTENNIELITKTTFLLTQKNKDIETVLKLKSLTLLYGVEIPVASSILTLCYPENYSVIDFRNWRQIFKVSTKKTSYTTKEYNEYLKRIKYLSKKFNFSTQQIDIAIWQKDINENG